MFCACGSLTNLDLSSFDTKNVTNMSQMFGGMIYDSYYSKLQTIYIGDNWNTDKVSPATNMFYYCNKLYGEKGSSCKDLVELASSDPDRYDIIYAKIDGGKENPGFFTKVGEPAFVAKEAYAILKDETLKFYYTENPPEGAYDIESEDINNQDKDVSWKTKVKKVVFDKSFKDFKPLRCNWFRDCENLTEIVAMDENLNTEYMEAMSFSNCSSLTSLDLSSFYKEKITNMSGMFYNCSSLKSINFGSFNSKKVIYMEKMFYNCSSLTEIKFNYVNTSNTSDIYYNRNMGYMFYNCSSLETLDLSGLNTENVTTMIQMFYNCSSLKSLDLSGFNTEKVTNMANMFYDCKNLINLDLSGFTNVNYTFYMFCGCNKLQTIYVNSSWGENISGSKYPNGHIFYDTYSLYGNEGTVYDDYNQDIEGYYVRIDGGELAQGFFTKKGDKRLSVISVELISSPKKEYLLGEELVFCADDKISIKFDNSTVKEQTIYPVFISGYDKNKIGKQTVRIEYAGKYTTFDVNVKAVEVEKIALTTVPEKLEYFEGENFSAQGGVLKISYNNGEKKTLDLSTEEVKISGFDKTKVGKQTLKVEAFGKETTFEVSVKAKTAISISITTSPKKTEYIKGEKLDVSEGEITIKYDNGEEKIAKLSETKISGFDRNKVGKQTLTVEYQGLTTTFDVKVEQENIVPKPENPETATDDISVNSNVKIWSNEKTIFIENGGKEIQIFDMSGRIIKTIKSDCTRVEIPMSKSGIYIVKTNSKTQKVIVK